MTTQDMPPPERPARGAATPTADARALSRRNLRVARLSIATAATLAALKLGAVVATGSLAIAAALTDSVMDVLASSVNFFAVRLAGEPADDEHHYGHGKAEGLAGMGQGLLIGFVGLFLVVEGAHRIGAGSGELERTLLGIVVMSISLVASAWIGWLLLRTGRQTGSVALQADAAHYTSDIWMNGGVLASLAAIHATGWYWIDGAVSCVVGAIVIWTAFRVLRRSARELMDTSLPETEVEQIRAVIAERVPEARDIHNLRTRKSGPDVFVDMHVGFDRTLSFPDAHRLAERVQDVVAEAVPGAQVVVHADPHPTLPSDTPA